MQSHKDLIKNQLCQVIQELISYSTYEIDNLTKIIDTVKNLNKRTTTVEEEILRGALYHDIGKVKHHRYNISYLGQIII